MNNLAVPRPVEQNGLGMTPGWVAVKSELSADRAQIFNF